jgi:hypothetical protein
MSREKRRRTISGTSRNRPKEMLMLHREKADLLPPRETLGLILVKNAAVFGQNQTNVAANGLGAWCNYASAGGCQSVVIVQG